MVLDPEDGTKERQQKQRSMLIQKNWPWTFWKLIGSMQCQCAAISSTERLWTKNFFDLFFYKIDDAKSPKCAASSQCTKDVKGLAQYWWSQTTYLAEINPYSSQLAGLYILMVPSWLLVRLVPELSSAISMDSDLSGPDIENWEL